MLLRYSDTHQPHLPLLVFIHGWPDTGELWQKQIEYFSKEYRCISLTLPGYYPEDTSKGADFPELARRVRATIEQIKGASQQSVFLVGHDWGALITYLVDRQSPTLAKGLITMDVGAHFKAINLRHVLFLVSYQWWLLAAFGIGKVLPFLGNFMTQWMSKLVRAPRGKSVYAKMNYPYFYFWRANLLKRYRESLPLGYRPQKPLLYLYGKAKKYHFHSRQWEETLSACPGSSVMAISKCDHWLMVRDPSAINAVMDEWLKKQFL